MNRRLVILVLIASLLAPEAALADSFGTLLGGVAGAVIGNNVGSRRDRKTNAIWGALGGAFLGNLATSGEPVGSGRGDRGHETHETNYVVNNYYEAEPSPPPVVVREYREWREYDCDGYRGHRGHRERSRWDCR